MSTNSGFWIKVTYTDGCVNTFSNLTLNEAYEIKFRYDVLLSKKRPERRLNNNTIVNKVEAGRD
jgi:hypothetical protein